MAVAGERGRTPRTAARAPIMHRDAVPRRILPNESKLAGVSLERVDADGTFCGYASLFGAVDLAKDVVERGAFLKSLRDRGVGGIRMLYQHDPNEPIGAWSEIREDGRGLFVRGRLTQDVTRAREVLGLMRAGALDGLSIGFRTVRARKDAERGLRRILEADLWEISVVTFPMQPGARVSAVKGLSGRDAAMAARLRAAAHLIKQQGKTMV